MIGRKGVKLLLEAAARVQGMGHRFSLLLVGDGPETAALKLHAERLGLANVYFQPAQPPASMPAVYRSANALIFPTLKDPWGLVVNEALWSDLPVVASIYAGCTSEIVPAGNRFDPLDPRDFDRVLVKAVTGQLKPPDTSVLLPCTRVAEIISQDILQTLMKQSPTAPSPTHGTPPLDA
jgi:glycosyltransferase involved in cell wall biosynthesis